MTETDKTVLLTRAAYLYAEATGEYPCSVMEKIRANVDELDKVISACRLINPVSPLADELEQYKEIQ